MEVTEYRGGLSLNLPGDRDTMVYQKPDFTPATYTILNSKSRTSKRRSTC